MYKNLFLLSLLGLLLALTGCKPDADGDGFRVGDTAEDDCDDANADINPDAAELCDGIDQNCDGLIDEGLAEYSWWIDGDGDGAGSGTVTAGCQADAPTSDAVDASGEEDCDDTDPLNYPSNVEVCDGQDNNCDTVADEDLDGDGDGVNTCGDDGEAGTLDDDCDDDDPDNYPDNIEACDAQDNNCDGDIDEGFDGDEDGVTTCGDDGDVATAVDNDCDDTDASVYPNAPELCDTIDNDCDGAIDALDDDYAGEDNDEDGDSSITCGGTDCDDADPVLNGLDLDLDTQTSCDSDCNDEDPTVLAGGQEFCDEIDNDCNGVVDDLVGQDGDGDGFDTSGCGFLGSDCDDVDPHVFPQVEYTSGYQRQCEPAVRPGFANSWAYARLNLPTYFEDPQTGTHYLYFRGYHNPAQHQFGYASSSDGLTWGPIEGPIFGESDTFGSWDGRKISHPSVVYVPGKPRPYLMAYHAQHATTSDRRIGIVTATTADGDSDGTFKRQDLGGGTVSEPIVDTSPNATAADNERALHPGLWYDEVNQVVHMWYTGRFGAANEFSIVHAACDTMTSDCGSESDWVKTDTSGDGDPDVWLSGDAGAWDEEDLRQVAVIPHSDPNGFFGYELEITYSSAVNGLGAENSIGAAQGDIDDSSSWEKVTADPVLTQSVEANRMDSAGVTGRGVRYDEVTGEYHMYYGTSVELPVDGDGQAVSLLWGPGNYSSGASYIGHAINVAPGLSIDSADCGSVSGEVEDHAPDTVALTIYDGSSEIVPQFSPDSTGTTTDYDILATTWTASGLGLAAGSHTLTVVATDAGGAERSTEITVTCP